MSDADRVLNLRNAIYGAVYNRSGWPDPECSDDELILFLRSYYEWNDMVADAWRKRRVIDGSEKVTLEKRNADQA